MGQIMTGSTVPPPYPASASYLTPRHLIFDDIRQFLTQPFMRTFFPSSCYLELRLLNLIKSADFLKLLFDDMSLHSDFHQVFVLLFSKLFSNHRLYFQTSISDMQRKELNRGVCKIFIYLHLNPVHCTIPKNRDLRSILDLCQKVGSMVQSRSRI